MRNPLPFITLLIIVLVAPTLGYTQKCTSLEAWNTIISKEFPTVNTSQIRSGGRVSNRILHNLYSDKYFVPFAGKSFDKVSLNAGQSSAKKLRKCRAKRKYQNLKNIGWLTLFGVEPLYNQRITARVKIQSVEINNLRIGYTKLLNLINVGEVSYDELVRYKSLAPRQFGRLMPSEVDNLLNVISKNQTKIANKSLLILANQYTKKKQDIRTLNELQNFEFSNRKIYNAAAEPVKKEVYDIINKSKISLVEVLMKNEQKKLDAINSKGSTIEKVNALYKRFNSSYSKYQQFHLVQNHYEAIKKKKTIIVGNMSSTIALAILNENDLKRLKRIDVTYLSNLTDDNPVASVLKTQLLAKERSIKKAQKIAAEEALAKKRVKEKAFSLEEAKRRATISKHKYRVKALRQELRVEHGSNLPRFEELHYMLQSYLTLVHKNKKYKTSDAEAFIRLVEKTGYMRQKQNNISDVERFLNRSGFRIVAYSLVGRPLTSVSLEIPRASKKMVELYSKELISEFRNTKKTTMTPTIMPTESDDFIFSGGTKYSLKLKANGTLVLRATENRELTLPMLADRVQVDTWRVSSLKTVTDVYVKKGQKVTLSASGRVKVGGFIGNVTPAGKPGYKIYSIDQRYNHGSLMAKIGRGQWSYVGTMATFTAKQNGILYLKINDKFPDNNEGSFNVKYVLQ